MSAIVPSCRIRPLNDYEVRPDGQFVLYWMTAFRRCRFNFALQHAVNLAKKHNRPLVVLDAVRLRYQWASDRLHRFLIDGMIDNAAAFTNTSATYFPFLEVTPGSGSGLVKKFCESAVSVVADDYPCFFHPTLYNRIAKRYPAKIELVDSNTILPMSVGDRTFTVAHSYRRFMQKNIQNHLSEFPQKNPLARVQLPILKNLPTQVSKRWQPTDLSKFHDRSAPLNMLEIDHTVEITPEVGGEIAARKQLKNFIANRITAYGHQRNVPDDYGSSFLSPYLHFGHISPHEIFIELMDSAGWSESNIGTPNGKMYGFWNTNEDSEAFLDQLLTWREIGFNMCYRESNFDHYETLPQWAQKTLADHETDERPHVYNLEQFETATTHDEIWNAAQRQLVREGRIHNYMRMLWGKKILHWSRSPREALSILIELNNKYALDGRDPNSYSGIFWTLGRYDRAWGPERPIFGKVRYMTSESTAKKWPIKKYLKRFAAKT